jgi:hypothetical protein
MASLRVDDHWMVWLCGWLFSNWVLEMECYHDCKNDFRLWRTQDLPCHNSIVHNNKRQEDGWTKTSRMDVSGIAKWTKARVISTVGQLKKLDASLNLSP